MAIFGPEVSKCLFERVLGPLDGKSGRPKNAKPQARQIQLPILLPPPPNYVVKKSKGDSLALSFSALMLFSTRGSFRIKGRTYSAVTCSGSKETEENEKQ